MNIEVNLIKHHQQMEEIERPETSKCSRQQNQLNKTLTNFRQKQGMGGGGGGANEQQLQTTNANINSGQQQYSIQKNQPLPPSMINIPNAIISDRQQSRSGTRQGRNNNTSFQTTGQGFFKETFYRDTNVNGNSSSNNNNNSMVFNNSSNSNNNVAANNNKINSNNNNAKNNATDTDEGITLDKYFGSNFQVINLGINNEEKPNKSIISVYVGNSQDQAQQNSKFNKIQPSFEESKQQSRQNKMSKEESNGGESNQIKTKRPSKIQAQSSFIEDNSGEYKDYMEEEFEIHETDEEYSESNRESQADLNVTDANYEDTVQKTNKSKRKSIEDRNRDKSQNNQDQSLTSKSIKQYLNTQESGDEKQIHIQKKLRDKYSKKMRHKPFNSTTLQSHQNSNNNNLDTSNQPSSTTSSNSQKNQTINQQIQQQSMNQQQQQPYLLQYQSSNNSNNQPLHDNNNYQTYNSGKSKYSTNNTSQSYNTNYSTNFNSNVTASGQNERGSLTLIDDQSQVNKTDFDSFNPKSGQNIQNSSNNNIFNSNNVNSQQQQQAQKKYKSNNDDSVPQYKTYNYFAGNRKEIGGGKEQNLNSSYLMQKQQQQQSFNHSTSLNQTDITINNDLQPQNSSQIDKGTKNYNIRKINKSQSPPVRDPFQPLITHQRNFSRDTTQLQNQQSFQLNNQYSHNNNSSSSSSMQNTINQASLASNMNSINTNNNNLAKNNISNMMNNVIQQNGVNNSQILNSQSGESFKQNNNISTSIQQNNSHIKVINNTNNINQGMINTGNINATIQNLQRKSKYGEFLDSQQNNNDKLSEMQKQFRTSFYHVKQQSMQHQNQQQNQNQTNEVNNFTQTSTSFANVIAAANGIQGFSNGQNPILAPLNSLPTNNSYYNGTSKNRLTLNEFYKHQSKYEDYGQPSGPPNINQYEELIADNLMRRTAKENKFLNQKEKLNELIKQEDINFVTKYAARFNLNNDECQQLIQTGKQEKVQIKKRMETPHKGFRGDFQQAQQKKKLSVTKEPKHPPLNNNNNNNPTLINRPQNDNNTQYQSKERNSK
ncbi:hypothetical protein TTHERM_00723570 (macronuclear) [Tetrahymena thermophila SB210]|uniref:Uncharacterized protein n=1 Tax=Tetrahymena thermophila (strain SB210) TaxID=312017 RepID=I7MCL5_TETTS|nr:hypothetical protein TTHERM_00723570 [Tetrahymena thermophila SB210]EAR84172.2 hypothetical protein TTHERM_00723570 [Tetrahymena thermophila SB210]|eukprot:XP_001031835.2 hypothetical protein TTHERM_00723570 [Tetrahymena thermophila SB210]